MPISDAPSEVGVISGIVRRRCFTAEQKLAIVVGSMQHGISISYVVRQPVSSADMVRGIGHRTMVSPPRRVFRWGRLKSEGDREAVRVDDEAVPAAEARRLEERVRDPGPSFGKKTIAHQQMPDPVCVAGAARRPRRARRDPPGAAYCGAVKMPTWRSGSASKDGFR